jgi:hypothetical protein
MLHYLTNLQACHRRGHIIIQYLWSRGQFLFVCNLIAITQHKKDEIETQISELLRNGMIQPSNSPFAYPIILARKKTGDWRLCVDYRRLNALTVKNKYPLPVIDELLDEVQGAKWFSSLDLSLGYQQIPMDPQYIPKTTFQTHTGHFEYRVMPYGLTGGPATF